jgi:hypothetical protein
VDADQWEKYRAAMLALRERTPGNDEPEAEADGSTCVVCGKATPPYFAACDQHMGDEAALVRAFDKAASS